MRLQALAKFISWLSCFLVFLVAMFSTYDVGLHFGQIVVFAVVVVHLGLMLRKAYVLAFKFASGELILSILLLLAILYPLPDTVAMNTGKLLLPFNQAIWVWIFLGAVFAILAWVCNKAAQELTKDNNGR